MKKPGRSKSNLVNEDFVHSRFGPLSKLIRSFTKPAIAARFGKSIDDHGQPDAETRELLLRLLDASARDDVGKSAFANQELNLAILRYVLKQDFTAQEVPYLHQLILNHLSTRAISDAYELEMDAFFALPDARLRRFLEMLLEHETHSLRETGLELLEVSWERDRLKAWIPVRVAQYSKDHAIRTTLEDDFLDRLVKLAKTGRASRKRNSVAPNPTRDNSQSQTMSIASGSDPMKSPRTERVRPEKPGKIEFETSGFRNLVRLVTDVVAQKKSAGEIHEIIVDRPADCRDADGAEWGRFVWWALCAEAMKHPFFQWTTESKDRKGLQSYVNFKTPWPLPYFSWHEWKVPLSHHDTRFFVDILASVASDIPEKDIRNTAKHDWRDIRGLPNPIRIVEFLNDSIRSSQDAKVASRFWAIAHWLSRPIDGVEEKLERLPIDVYETGAVTDGDLVHALIACDCEITTSATQLKVAYPKTWEKCARVTEAVARVIVESELRRKGPDPTALARRIPHIDLIPGLPTLLALLDKLAGRPFCVAGYDQILEQSVDGRLTQLLRKSVPEPNSDESQAVSGHSESPTHERLEAFAKGMEDLVDRKRITPERLRELAFLAPAWARYLEAFLAEPGLADMVCWLNAELENPPATLLESEGFIAQAFEEFAGMPAKKRQHIRDEAMFRWFAIRHLAEARYLQAKSGQNLRNSPDAQSWDGNAPSTLSAAARVAWRSRVREKISEVAWNRLLNAAKAVNDPEEFKAFLRRLSLTSSSPAFAKLVEAVARKHEDDAISLIAGVPLAAGEHAAADFKRRCEALLTAKKKLEARMKRKSKDEDDCEEEMQTIDLIDESLVALSELASEVRPEVPATKQRTKRK